MITVNANASTLCPKTKPEDMEKLKELYRFLDSQLAGLESKMKELDCEKLVITVDTAESNGKAEIMRLGRDEVTFGLNEVTCVDCDTPMVWSDEFREWECPACGTIAYQDETCCPDEIIYDSANQDDDESNEESISVYDAAEIWDSNGRDEEYTFGYSEEELEAAL